MRYNGSMKTACRQLLITAVFILVFLSSGCTKNYGRKEISDYVKERCGISSFRVSRDRIELTSEEDSYTDYLWTITENDGTEFYVLDDYHWGMEALVNTLRTDYYDVHLVRDFSKLPHSGIRLASETENGLCHAVLEGDFSTRSELQDELKELADIRADKACPDEVSYVLKFNYPYRVIGEYESGVGDTVGNLSSSAPDVPEAEKRMLLTCVDHQLSCRFDFTEEEIRSAVEANTHQLGVRNASGEMIWYDDLCADQYSYGVSFASLYVLLERNGFAPEGTPEHYRVTAPDGTSFEISYSFRHPLPEYSEGIYYLKNGEITDMSGYFHTHFTAGEIRNLFGLEVYERWQVQ